MLHNCLHGTVDRASAGERQIGVRIHCRVIPRRYNKVILKLVTLSGVWYKTRASRVGVCTLFLSVSTTKLV